jgi:hypothetical protein
LRRCNNVTRRDEVCARRRIVTPYQRHSFALLLAACASLAACAEAVAPENPAWAEAEPILRAQCGHCHGSTARTTGAGIRFDFFDTTANHCSEAATALASVGSARVQANAIATAITTTDPVVRPSMPPIPAPYLSDREWLTILRWTANPVQGNKPAANRPPRIDVSGIATSADDTLEVNVVVDDPDGEPVVGVLKVGDAVGVMDRAGSFSARFDTSTWPAGSATVSAVLCDAWSQVSFPALHSVDIIHQP